MKTTDIEEIIDRIISLEDGKRIKEIFLKNNQLPIELIDSLYNKTKNNFYLQLKAMSKFTTSEELEEIYRKSTNRFIDIAILKNPNINKNLVSEIIEIKSAKLSFLNAALSNPNIDSVAIKKIFNNNGVDINNEKEVKDWQECIKIIAAHPNTSEKLIEQLTKSKNLSIKAAAYSNPSIPEFILENILFKYKIKDMNSAIRDAIVSNKKTPLSVLKEILKYHDFEIGADIASHPNIPLSELELLVDSENFHILSGIIKNPNVSLNILEKLSHSTNHIVITELLKKENITSEIIDNILKNKLPFFYKTNALLHKKVSVDTLIKYSGEDFKDFHSAVVLNPKTPIEILKKFSQNDNFLILNSLSMNPASTSEILNNVYIKSTMSEITNNLASHPNTPKHLIKKILNTSDSNTDIAILKNPSLSVDELKHILKTEDIIVACHLAEKIIYTYENKPVIYKEIIRDENITKNINNLDILCF